MMTQSEGAPLASSARPTHVRKTPPLFHSLSLPPSLLHPLSHPPSLTRSLVRSRTRTHCLQELLGGAHHPIQWLRADHVAVGRAHLPVPHAVAPHALQRRHATLVAQQRGQRPQDRPQRRVYAEHRRGAEVRGSHRLFGALLHAQVAQLAGADVVAQALLHVRPRQPRLLAGRVALHRALVQLPGQGHVALALLQDAPRLEQAARVAAAGRDPHAALEELPRAVHGARLPLRHGPRLPVGLVPRGQLRALLEQTPRHLHVALHRLEARQGLQQRRIPGVELAPLDQKPAGPVHKPLLGLEHSPRQPHEAVLGVRLEPALEELAGLVAVALARLQHAPSLPQRRGLRARLSLGALLEVLARLLHAPALRRHHPQGLVQVRAGA
mmetsp:Transcript_6658/g.17056  ORF Transcript_6658/g.17056 Transcript_6658/m.17056 type:complete len:382 (+) Transcript_6658:1079-2224(+)